MAADPLVIRGINWRETFPFTNIFRAFRVALHPSKLVLALLALLTLYLGGRILDMLWFSKHRAVPAEIALYQRAPDAKSFADARVEARKGVTDEYSGLLRRVARQKLDPKTNAPVAPWSEYLNDNEKARAAAAEGKHTSDVRYWVDWNVRESITGRKN